MKSKCSLILKSSIALILTFLMLFGSIASVIAASVDVAVLGAESNLSATGSVTASNKLLFLKPGTWGTASGNIKYYVAAYNSSGRVGFSSAATTTTVGSDTYYVATCPDGCTNGYRWVRGTGPSGTHYNVGPWVGEEKNASYVGGWANWEEGSPSGSSTYNVFANNETIYIDANGNSYWSSYDISVTNNWSGGWGGNNMTKIATGLYKYTQTSNWDCANDGLKFYRGGSSNKWNLSNTFDIGSAYFSGNNAMYMGSSAVYENCGTQTTLSLTSISAPTLTATTTTPTYGDANTITASGNTLNYSRGGSAKTTTLTDAVYNFYVDGSSTAAQSSTSKTYDASGLAVGTHTITCKISSSLTGLMSTAGSKTITVSAANTPLSAPTNVKIDTNTSSSVSASPSTNSSLTWSSVTNAGSYEVYKGTTKVDTVTTTSYSIARKSSNAGSYTVKAVPSNTTLYSTSAASSAVTLTVNKVQMTAPSASASSTDIKSGASTTITISNFSTLNTSYISDGYANLKRCTRAYQATTGSGTASGNVTSGTDTLSPTSSIQYFYYLEPTTTGSEYYSQSGNSSFLDIYVAAAPSKRLAGDLAGTEWNYNSGITMTQYQGSGIYYWTSSSQGSGNHYFAFYDSSGNQYSGNNYTTDCAITLGESNKYTLTKNTNAKSFYVSGTGVFVVYYDTVNNKIWVTQNTWAITPHAYYADYNLATGAYKADAEGTIGGTISPSEEQLVEKGSSTTLTATAASGYTFQGWYSSTTFTNTNRVTASATYTFSPSASGDYYAYFKKNEPTKYTLTVANADNATVTAKWNGTTVVEAGASSGTKSVPVPQGAEVTVTVTLDDHCTQTSVTPALTSGKFTMPGSDTAVTVVATKNNYTITTKGQGTTNGSDYTDLANSATGSANSGTYADGITINAPAVDGYTFVEWVVRNGVLGSVSTAASNTFKPTANGATAIAQYKKNYTITTEVVSGGEGNGTATVGGLTSKTCLAGDSYTVTLTPDSHSTVDYLRNAPSGANLTLSSNTYTTTASANATYYARFTTAYRILSDASATWDGDGVAAVYNNGHYEHSYTVSAGTYYFRTMVNGNEYSVADSVNEKDDANIATIVREKDAYGTLYNAKLTLTANAIVTVKVGTEGDGANKIYEMEIIPNSTQRKITFKKVDGATISGTYYGTNFSTASADAEVNAYEGTNVSFTVTAGSNKYVSGLTATAGTFSPAFSAGATYEGSISVGSSAATVTPAVTAIPTVTTSVNKTDRGSVSVSGTPIPGETITITATEKAGVLSTVTATVNKGNASSETVTLYPKSTASTSAAAPASTGFIASALNKIDLAATGATETITYEVPASTTSLAINAVFDAYSAESDWYYNGYDTSGNAKSGYYDQQMTEGMIGGEKFSYYHVTGRGSENYDQLFTVSDGHPSSGTRYIYFTRPTDWGNGWSNSNNPHAYFLDASNNKKSGNWPGAGHSSNYQNDYNQTVYKFEIPTGATNVIINDNGGSGKQTVNIDLTTTSGAYYLAGGGEGTENNGYVVGEWDTGNSDQGWVDQGTEYYKNSSGINFSDHWFTGGFGDYNAKSHQFARPSGTSNSKDLNDCKDDYYIVVLYPNTSYTFNNNTEPTGANPVVLWMDELPGGESDSVTVYAKDGAIRAETFGVTYANIADTAFYTDSTFTTACTSTSPATATSHNGNIAGQTYETKKFEKGDTIYVRTIINNTAGTGKDTTANNAKYYVRGFCVNGVVSSINSSTSAGTSVSVGTAYDLTYTVPDDYDGSKIEITPIFYLADTANNPIVTFRVQDFPKDKYGWGDTLYCYPFYGTMGSNNNAFGAYPGQPVVYYNGQYSIQIPRKSTAWDPYLSDELTKEGVANTYVSGITMSNGYFDLVHRSVMGYGSNSASSDHVQTYDYGDFYKIFNEKSPVDNIVYDFKYRTAKHNFENQPAASVTKSDLVSNYDTGGNGFELLKNFHGKNVDLFGNALSGNAADPTKTTPVYVISIGGVNGSAGVENIAGWYATEWMVYGSSDGTNYSRVTAANPNNNSDTKQSIPPEVLILNDDDSFNTTTYPSADANHQITDWKNLYDTLKANYTGKPVYISYEAADAQIGERNYATSGGGGATRNDGRWLYSKEGENITSNIKIQYSTDNGVSYTDLNTTTPQVSGLSAYFTNAEVSEGATTYSTTIDSDKTFDFTAKTSNADYKFVGWYMDNENKTLITTDNTGSTERSGSYTFIARFKEVTTGQLILSHNVATDASHTGSGTATIAVTVTDPDNNNTVVKTVAATTSDITLDDKIISTDKGNYDIAVTLNATPAGEDTFALVNTTADAKFMGNATSYPTVPQTFTFKVSDLFSSNTQNVKSLIYNSYFNQTQFKYKFTFTFTDRNNASKNYVREGTLTAAQLANESYYVKDGSTRTLKAAFINRLAPEESNFNQSLGWTINDVNFPASPTSNAYTIDQTYTAQNVTEYVKDDQGNNTATPVRSTTRTATFDLPYVHNTTTGVAIEESGKVLEATATVFTVSNIDFGSIPVVSDAYVTAPTKLYANASDETGKFFQYWSIKKTSSDENEVGRCYFNEFNLVMFDNYYITPVYGTEALDLNNTGAFTSVTYLETSRNQWNTDGTDSTKAERTKAADLLYNDLVVNYNYNNLDVYANGDDVAAVTDLGYIVERVQQLDSKQDGTLNTDLSLYNTTGLDEDGAIAVVTGYTTPGTTQNGITKYTGSDSRIARYSVDKTVLDNKNRLEIYDAYYNSAGWSHDKQSPAAKYTYKNYVYKVYTYMVVSGTTYVSKNPAYFTMYDEATK